MESMITTTATTDRQRILDLVDYLAAYDQLRNPPVRDIRSYELFRRRSADLPDQPEVHLSHGGDD